MFWIGIRLNGLKINGTRWRSQENRFPRMAPFMRKYLEINELTDLVPPIPYVNDSKHERKGRTPSSPPCRSSNLYRVMVRSNGIGTIVVETFIDSSNEHIDLNDQKNELVKKARDFARCVLKAIKSYFSSSFQLNDNLQSSIESISFGEPFCLYFSNLFNNGVSFSKLKKLAAGASLETNRAGTDQYFVSSSTLGVLFKSVRKPRNYVIRSREGVALALGIKFYLDTYFRQKNYLYASDLDFLYLVHFLNPYIMLKRQSPDGFLPSLTRIWFKRISLKFALQEKFRKHLSRFTTGHIKSNLIQIQLLFALKTLGLSFTPPTIQNLSPSFAPLEPEEISVMLAIIELQKNQGTIFQTHIWKLIKSKSFRKFLVQSEDMFHSLKKLEKDRKNNPWASWENLGKLLDKLHDKNLIKKTEVFGRPGRGKIKYSYNLIDRHWNFSEELVHLIRLFFSDGS